MFFLNLSAGEFFALLGVLGGAVTALYFLDRSKKRRIVSTLQFWPAAAGAIEQRSRKKVNQPWSLVLQLLSLALLLLAIAQLQWGTRALAGRDHVLLIDTSSWSQAKLASGTVLQAEKRLAARYISSLPVQDRVLLVRADGLTTPVTLFTSDREQTRTALQGVASSVSALDLQTAFGYAAQAQRSTGGMPGEIVYVGPERINQDVAPSALPGNLRVLPVPITGANYGIRRLEAVRSELDSGSWHGQITLMNYGDATHSVQLRTQFAGTRFSLRSYSLPPHRETTAEYNFVTNTPGELSTQIEGADILPADNRASLSLPGGSTYTVAVYTTRPGLFKPLLSADRRISATYLDPSQASISPRTDVIIFDGSLSRPATVTAPSIWINPSAQGSPFKVKEAVNRASIHEWNSNLLMATGLGAHEDRLEQAKIFATQPDDLTLASVVSGTAEGPVVVLRPKSQNGVKMAAIGFDPLSTRLRFTVTTPLLFANLLEWMAPEAQLATELKASRVGAASVTLDPGEAKSALKVLTDDGMPLPFTVHGQTLQLFSNKPAIAHIISTSRARVLSLNLPDVAESTWKVQGARVAEGLPGMMPGSGSALDLWQWLACLGAVGLLAEWYLFGRSKSVSRSVRGAGSNPAASERHERDLVAR